MTESENLLLAAGVPQTLWQNNGQVIEYLARKVIALSERAGGDTLVLDEEKLKELETQIFDMIIKLNNIDVFKMYSKSYIMSLSEAKRVATKAALIRFANERNIQPSDHWT